VKILVAFFLLSLSTMLYAQIQLPAGASRIAEVKIVRVTETVINNSLGYMKTQTGFDADGLKRMEYTFSAFGHHLSLFSQAGGRIFRSYELEDFEFVQFEDFLEKVSLNCPMVIKGDRQTSEVLQIIPGCDL